MCSSNYSVKFARPFESHRVTDKKVDVQVYSVVCHKGYLKTHNGLKLVCLGILAFWGFFLTKCDLSKQEIWAIFAPVRVERYFYP